MPFTGSAFMVQAVAMTQALDHNAFLGPGVWITSAGTSGLTKCQLAKTSLSGNCLLKLL